jgi:hypothetical protein
MMNDFSAGVRVATNISWSKEACMTSVCVNRIFKSFMAAAVVCVILPITAVGQTQSWDVGHPDNIGGAASVKATLGENRTLTISGTGDMMNYSSGDAPWYNSGAVLTNVIIEDGITSIGNWAFFGCSGLTSITIPNSLTSIGDRAFSDCSGLTSITIPNSVTSIGNWAFFGCSGLTSITIPNSVTSIGNSAFWGCSGLTSITIPNSVTTIGNSAFRGCTNITSVTISGTGDMMNYPYGGDEIIPWFSSRAVLTDVIIEDGITSIGNWAFSGCSGLTSITIPNSVTSIGDRAFSGCSGLNSITIPNSVTSIGSSAFSGCSGLTSITIPNSVTSIGDGAFSSCYSLTSVTIPNSVTSIGGSAFYGCRSLTSITIPNSVITIGDRAFEGCSGLTSVTSLNPAPPEVSFYTFTGVNKELCTLFVPQASISAYRAADVWKEFLNFKDAESVTSVLSPGRVIPKPKPDEDTAVIAPVSAFSSEFTVGPNPVAKQSGEVKFFRQGKSINNATLYIYNASGSRVNKINISDKSIGKSDRREVGRWNLKDSKGRAVSEGTYLVKGVISTRDGKREKVSLILGIQ